MSPRPSTKRGRQWLNRVSTELGEGQVKLGGRLVLTVQDCRSPSQTSWKRELALRLLPFMPRPIQRVMSARFKHRLWLSEGELRAILDAFPWSQYTITERNVEAHCRKHWICVATREQGSF
jgi:hypothetical protein